MCVHVSGRGGGGGGDGDMLHDIDFGNWVCIVISSFHMICNVQMQLSATVWYC